jgi:hypothetical protein
MPIPRFLLPLVFVTLCFSTVARAQTGGYMVSEGNALAYLRITRTGNVVKGYLQIVSADNSAAGYATHRDDITGTATNGTVMLKVNSFLGQGTHELDGDFRGGKLYLSAPNANGQIVKLTFTSVTVDAWNVAVAKFERRRTVLQQRRATLEAAARSGGR